MKINPEGIKMKNQIITTFLTAIFLVTATIPAFSQSTEQLFQEGIMKEEGEGNLSEAINIFNSIVGNSTAEEALQAKALLHVGLCFEKLGREEATKAYQELVNNFPGQENEVAIAKERLSQLIQVAETILTTPIEPRFTKVRTPFNIPQWSGSRLSPDGKILAFGSENNIWTVPIQGKVDPDLTGEPNKLEGASDVLGEGLSWSGDGRFIAFSRVYTRDLRGGGTLINFNPDGAYIDVIPSSGGEPKRIPIPHWLETNGDTQRKLSMSSDGKLVAFDSGGQIYVATVETGDIRQVTKDGGISPCFSPDGKKIAYLTPGIYQDNPPARLHEVWVISTEGGDPVKVSGNLTENLSNKGPTWSPDGSMIAFGRVNTEGELSSEVCIVDLSDEGRPIAPPVQIELPLFSTDFLTGWTPDNKIGLILESPYHEYVYTVPVSGGKATQVSPLDGLAGIPNWSPEGEHIYFRWKGGGLGSVPGDGGEVSVHPDLDRLRNETGFFTVYPGAGNSVSPDGKSIVFSGAMASEGPYIYTIPIGGGEPKQVTDKEGNYPCWSPNGNWIAYLALEEIDGNKSIATIYKVPKDGGESQKITTSTNNVTAGGFDWSPDGTTIAYFSKKEDVQAGTLNLVPANGGESIEVCQIQNITAHNNVSWSPDGQKIAFVSSGKIWIVQAQGGQPVEVKTDVDAWAGTLDWSPDGQKITFSAESGMKPEFWFMEDFLPLDQLAQNNEPVPEDEGIVIKQAWTGSDVDNFGSISQDGEYLSYVNWDTGDLSLRNLSTKQNSSLVQGNWDTPMQYAQYNVISPNGKQIAYQWFNDNASDLYLINIDNPIPKLLYRKEDANVFPISWLSNNKIIIGINNKVVDDQIGSYSIVDGTLEILKTFNQINWAWLTSSPDENYIAYDYVNRSQDGTFDINLLSMDGKGEIALVEHPANDKVLGWMPENNEFLFISDRSGTWDLWAIAIDNGKPLGQERRIYTDIGEVKPLGITKNGECFYGFSNRNFNAYILPVNNLTGNPEGNPEIPLAGSIYSKNWSPDGKYMARVQEGEGGFELIIRDEENGNERRLAEELFYILAPYWSRDQQSLYIFGMDMKELQTNGYEGSIFTLDLKSNNLKEQLLISDYNYTPPKDAAPPIAGHAVSDDQQYIYLLFQNDWIVKHDLINGKDTILYRHPQFVRGVFQLSPDGNKLLFAIQNEGENMSRLLTISTQGGDEMELCTSQESNISGSAFWSPDGKYVYFSERHEGTNLWKVDANGGTPEKVWHTDKGAESFIMHPSGEKISYSVRERTTEIRVIEGLAQEIEKVFDGEN